MPDSRSSIFTLQSTRIALFITFLFLVPIYAPFNQNLVENKEFEKNYYASQDTNMYRLYFAEESSNDSGGGDGSITTKVPDEGGQKTGSVLDETIEFFFLILKIFL